MRRSILAKLATLTLLSASWLCSGQSISTEGWRLAVPDDPTWEWNYSDLFEPQSDFKTEWWYYTGHLSTEDDDWFGYQVTFFRSGMASPKGRAQVGPSDSKWRFQDVWLAHVALTVENEGQYHHSQRMVRGAMDLAGLQRTENSLTINLGDWATDYQLNSKTHLLSAAVGDWSLSLTLQPDIPVRQGQKGLSQKAQGIGRASYYYSYPNMPTQGQLTSPSGESIEVSGSTWFDREIGSNQLGENQIGWQWFAIQLETGDALMLYRMRLRSGGFDTTSHGKWIPAISPPEPSALKINDYSIEPKKTWHSQASGADYPIEWTIKIPALLLELDLKATLPQQEFVAEFKPRLAYWEGSHVVSGHLNNKPIRGRAYVELTGYSGPLPGF